MKVLIVKRKYLALILLLNELMRKPQDVKEYI